jgi:hypothetical protein
LRPETLANAAHAAWTAAFRTRSAILPTGQKLRRAPLMDVIRVDTGTPEAHGAGGAGMRGVGTEIGRSTSSGSAGSACPGIAEVMHNLGYSVQGSDIAEGLRDRGSARRGITVMIGHAAANVMRRGGRRHLDAVKRDNPGSGRGASSSASLSSPRRDAGLS